MCVYVCVCVYRYTQCSVEDQGSGIGLALVKQIAEANGGTVMLDSEYNSGALEHGPGSRFVAVLSLAEATAPGATVVSSGAIQLSGSDDVLVRLRGPYRVLIVDDDNMIRLVLRRLMTEVGFDGRLINEAKNGEAAIAALRGEPNKYDLITMDNASVL